MMSETQPAARARESGVYAALDLGTNNCRLLVASAEAGQPLKVLDSFSRIVKLGEGVSASGQLSADAMDRTLDALEACRRKLEKYRLDGSRFVATEACRRASNAPAFMQRVEEKLGLSIEIISSEEEARLAFVGCASLLVAGHERALVFDIGGGSTELMWVDAAKRGERKGILDWLSIGSGVMNLADRFGGQNFVDMAFADMVRHIQQQLVEFDAKNGIAGEVGAGRVQMLSTSGTVTTLAAIHLGLPKYDRARIDGIRLEVSDIRVTTQRLLAMRPSERFNHPCIGPDRADYILSGCAIFHAISNLWPTANITIADRGVREGIILSLLPS